MNTWIGLAFVLAAAVVVVGYLKWRSAYKPPVRLSKVRQWGQPAPYIEVNTIANTFSAVLELRANRSPWPKIINALNPHDDPQTRTVLLELRWLCLDRPDEALAAIEAECIAKRQIAADATRIELLELAKARVERAN